MLKRKAALSALPSEYSAATLCYSENLHRYSNTLSALHVGGKLSQDPTGSHVASWDNEKGIFKAWLLVSSHLGSVKGNVSHLEDTDPTVRSRHSIQRAHCEQQHVL